MRWLLISRQHHPSHGGIGTYVQRFLSAARGSGWHVELMTQPGLEWPACARVHEVTTPDMQPEFEARLADLRRRHVVRPYRYALWATAVAERLLRIADEFDAIEFVDCQAEGFAALGCPAVHRRHAGAAFIVHAHTPMWIEETISGADCSQFGRAIYHDWERAALQAADGVIVTSRVLGDAISDSAPSTVIPYPIEEAGSISTANREARIVLVGSVQPRKGVDLWARSLNQVLRAKPRATAMLIGPDTPTAPDGLSMAAYAQRMIDPRVIDRFQWTGSLPHNQVRELIATSALAVVPSRLESYSFVASEALLAGTPVIVSNQTGIAEHVPSLPRVRIDDVDALAEAQIETLSQPDSAMEKAARCRVEMLNSCSPSRVLEMRCAMLAKVRKRKASQRVAAKRGDSLAEMSSFLRSVEASEAVDAGVCASSARL